MLEYIFFDPRPRDLFIQFLESHGVECSHKEDDGVITVMGSEDIDDELNDRIEDYYDEMLDYNQELSDQSSDTDPDNFQTSGIMLNLKDGATVYAPIKAQILNKVVEALSADEFAEFIDNLATAIEEKDVRTLCERIRDLKEQKDRQD